METIISDAKHAVLPAQNDRWGLGPVEIGNCDAKAAVLNALNHRWRMGPIDKRHSGSKHAV